MSDVVGRGTIELVADARKLRAGIEDAKKSLRTLGEGQSDISKGAAQSIDRYIGKLQQQNATINKSARETELFKLALRGASNEQLKSADAALRIADNQKRVAESAQSIRTAFVALGTIAVTSILAAAVAFDRLVKSAGEFQDMAEKVGDTASNFSSLAVAAAVGGASMESVVGASTKLSKALTGVDDDSQAAGAAVEALGLNLASFKQLGATDQIEAVAKAMAKFEDGTGKTAIAMALFGKAGAEMLPFLKELSGETGRVNILTSEQIRLADEYSDKQKRLTAEIGLYAQAIATDLLPAYTDLKGAFLDVLKGIAGVEAGAAGLRQSNEIQEFAERAARAMAFVADSVDGVIRVFQLAGKTIGFFAAIDAAVLRGQFSEIKGIVAAAKEDFRQTVDRETFGKALERRIDERKNFVGPPAPAIPQGRPRLNFSGAAKKDTGDTAAQEAKAQLALDLEQIRKASEATINAFSNQDKILQALHSASLSGDKKFFSENLADEAQYFSEKRTLLLANSAEQERALQEEIARLQLEKFTGKNAAKDRLDNERNIADAQAKLAKVRADSSAEIHVLQIDEFSSAKKLTDENNKLVQSYNDAKIAADDYIQSVIRRNQAELAGVGKGNQFRDIQAGRNQIEDKFIAERASLNRDLRNQMITPAQFAQYLKLAQDTYSREIILYDDRTEAILRSQGDWVNGATEAFQNYIDEAANVSKQTENLLTDAFKGAEDALVEFATTGKLNFKSLIDSIVADVARMQAKQVISAGAKAIEGSDLFSSIANFLKPGAKGWTSGSDLPLGSFASGINYVPKTGIYQLHEGERVTPKAENTSGGWGDGMTVVQNFAISGATDTRSQMQIAAAAYDGLQRSRRNR